MDLTCGVVIPAYQAVATIADVVRRSLIYGEMTGVIVVDDGSTDGTGDAARGAGALVVTHPVNRGKGAALMSGFARASALGWDAAITLDADGQHDPAMIPAFLEEYRRTRAEIIVGARPRSGSRMPLQRRLSNRMSSAITSWLAGVSIPDSQSGYRLVARRVWESVPLRRERYDLETEILVKAGRMGFHIVSLPIPTLYGDERSHFHPVRDTARMVRLFWSLFWEKDPVGD